MKIRSLLVIGILSFSQLVLSQGDELRIENAYKLNDKNFDIDCYYFSPTKNFILEPITDTRFSNNQLSRDYYLVNGEENLKININISPSIENLGEYKVEFENGHTYTDKIEKNFNKGFYLRARQNEVFDQKYEINKFYCKINFASAKPFKLSSEKKYHINVHPHKNYDFFEETIDGAQTRINDSTLNSLVLFEEEIDGKGNFVDLKSFLETGIIPELPLNIYKTSQTLNEMTDILISPAGHNRYRFNERGEYNITYTGGYHNYCIWNNTRNLITGFLRSLKADKLVINYPLDSVVAYRKGIIGGLSFKKSTIKDTRLLKKVFENNEKQASSYLLNYFNYFTGSFLKTNTSSFLGRFKELKIKQLSKYGNHSKTLSGSGERVLEIEFNYL